MPREVIDYKALVERIELYASLGVEGCDRWRADLRTVVTMLEGMADEKPALWMQSNHVSWAGKQPFMARCAPTQLHPDFVPVYLRPTPQSQPTDAQIEAAEAKPVAWMDEFGNAFPLDAWKPAKRTGYLDYHKKAWKPLFTHPAPQPQRLYGTDTMSEMGIVPMCDEPERQPVSEPRPCTCHPNDNPPVPCARQYALNECRAVHGEPTEAQIEAWQLLADLVAGLEATHWSSWQTTAHFDSALDAARAALAAKDE